MLILLVVSAAAVAGCGGSSHAVSTSADGTVHYVMPTSSQPTSCALQLSGHDAVIVYQSESYNVAPACTAMEQVQASSGELWNPVANPGDQPAGLTLTCGLTDANNDAFVDVWDTTSAIYGQDACTSLISVGWHQT